MRKWCVTAFALLTLSISSTSTLAEQAQPSAAQWYADYARDSRLVQLPNGRSLNLYCIGSGSPTVLLESGITESAYSWRAVQGRIASLTRVCAYDRAGMGKSPPGPFPRDTRAQASDLYALVKAADLKPPYVLVGHSMGGLIVRLFASRHLRDVAGMVLVDPSVENQVPLMEKALPAGAANDQRQMRQLHACADPQRTAQTAKDCTRRAPEDFSPQLAEMYEASVGLPYFQTVVSEAESFLRRDSAEVAAERRSFGDMPLIVLTRGALSTDMPKDQAETEWKLWNGLHDQVAKLSTAGVNRTVPDSGHYIQIDKPDAVVDAVSEVVSKVRAKSRP